VLYACRSPLHTAHAAFAGLVPAERGAVMSAALETAKLKQMGIKQRRPE
jgi:hypothetical protein